MATSTAKQSKKTRRAVTVRFVTTNRAYAKCCKQSLERLPRATRQGLDLLAFDRWSESTLEAETPESGVETVFISRLSDLPSQAQYHLHTGSTSRYLLFLEGLPVEAVTSRILSLGVRHPRRLHIAREDTPDAVSGVIHRVIAGMAQSDGPKRIADAWIEHGELVMLSPRFERMSVPLSEVVKYIGDPPGRRKDFEIDEDGSFLYWPHADVHLGWEQCLQVIDPAAALAAQDRTTEFNTRYGAAIRRLREEHELTQADIDGLTERHLRRIEKGQCAASKATLDVLAISHDLSLAEYMKQIAKRVEP